MTATKVYGSVPDDAYRRRSSVEVYRTFLDEFHASNGGWLLILIAFLTSMGVGGLVGVVPQVATQRFAEEVFGYDGEGRCNSSVDKPLECVEGAEYAQSAASYSAMARNLLALLTNSVAGSYSDTHGRRGVQILCLLLLTLSPLAFLVIQICDSVPPIWYYILEPLSGFISIISIGFTQLADIMPPRHRAPAYGLFFGAFMGGLALAPQLATLLSHSEIAVFSVAVRILALMIAFFFLPETLVVQERSVLEEELEDSPEVLPRMILGWEMLWQPIQKMEILQRSKGILLISGAAFCSKLVFSADITLLFYYLESNLGVTDQDVAHMMLVAGVLGVLVQAGLLKYLISLLGERRLLVASFASGTLHNLIYGFAAKKWIIYLGLVVASVSNTNNALLNARASRFVAASEQGQIQGALFGLTSLAEAIGPVTFNYVYRNWHTFGPGTMFVVGAILYAFGMVAVALVPSSPKRDYDDSGTAPPPDEEQTTMDGSTSEAEHQALVVP